MNKSKLVAAMAAKAKRAKKDAKAVLNAFTDTVADALKKGGKIILGGFGTFETRARADRESRNPQKGATIKIAASKTGKALKGAMK